MEVSFLYGNMDKSHIKELKKMINKRNPVFICIGTDRFSGDCLGPLVGSYLKGLGYKVYGTIGNAVHAKNLHSRLEVIKKNLTENDVLIAIDACLSKPERIGHISFSDEPMKPGSGVDKNLGEVGDISIKGIVNTSGFMEIMVLSNTPLSLVDKLATDIVRLIQAATNNRRKFKGLCYDEKEAI